MRESGDSKYFDLPQKPKIRTTSSPNLRRERVHTMLHVKYLAKNEFYFRRILLGSYLYWTPVNGRSYEITVVCLCVCLY